MLVQASKRKSSKETRRIIAEKLKAGISVSDICEQFNCSTSNICNIRREFDIPNPQREKTFNMERSFKILKDLLNGKTQNTCSVKYQVSNSTIAHLVKNAKKAGWL